MIELLAALALTAPSSGQTAQDDLVNMDLAAYERMGQSGRVLVTFYRDPAAGTDQPTFKARRALITPSGLEQIAWARETECPALADVIVSLDSMVTPQFNIRGSTRLPIGTFPNPPAAIMDGDTVTVSVVSRGADAARDRVAVTSSTGLFLEFANYADRSLAPCWRSGEAG